jgi:hypothetical protein
MITGFEKIVEERIKLAQRRGEFENLSGTGLPLKLDDDRHIPQDLRLAHKILKNADCLPPEIELKKQIDDTKTLLAGMQDTAQKYQTLKKLNFLIMKLNSMRGTAVENEIPQLYSNKVIERLESQRTRK